jgi:CubicO group peptidase (beta-lactamase class C family)
MTAAVVVTWKGRIVAERYANGISMHTPLESWSMGKSVTATMVGILIAQGVYDLWQPAPIPEWQSAGDPRAKIRIADLLRMSSGLRIRAPFDPGYDASGPYPDHLYLYTGTVNSFHYAATRPLEWPPNTVGRYRNTDPVLVNYLIRLGIERRGGDYLAFPQRALFDRIGVRSMVIETDPFGDLLTQGYDLACFRMVCGMASGSCRRDSCNSQARWRRPGLPTGGPSTAAFSGSTATAASRCPRMLITWREPAASSP